ncbi:hypothetical protein BX264_3606 [Streptomyces sp. 2333.5]|uniref:hypothetical protein n=1 Tax=unclassified Streptomyces TaxID=2593676 RepID=UPI00089C5FED|nr:MULTISPECIES: hypothetical protein [unclassified Streptomyces]PJJ03235.1 hypothetical protein BX264_3606 [Streptomyces sp. 2333.5]SED52141.1 hypothetical protein SAMN05428943_3803 [Streptomyces sp. 2314.4]SEE36768.1 hypothetical protein SAMN05428942_3708 [Streptomyces sp. 2112.2]
MNSAPHLLNEDRAEFARILDEALRTAEYRPGDLTGAAGKQLSTEQLRAMALSATTAIAACATAEYQRYVELRAETRAPTRASSAAGTAGAEPTGAADGGAGPATAAALDEAETTGAGLTAMIAVLAPVLAGIAAVLFLLIGYVLSAISPDKSLARPLISVGWIFAALTAAGTLVAMGGLLVTALRNGSSAQTAGADDVGEALQLAREAWRSALLERGLLPFLREALADPAATPDDDPTRYVPRRTTSPESRIPTLGYTRPEFTSPDSGSSGSRPRYSSPDFTSPEYGGPDHQPE